MYYYQNQPCLCPGIRAFPLRGDGVRVPDAVGRGAGADEEDTRQDQGEQNYLFNFKYLFGVQLGF